MNTQVHTNVDSLFPTRWSSAAGRGVEIFFYQKTKEKTYTVLKLDRKSSHLLENKSQSRFFQLQTYCSNPGFTWGGFEEIHCSCTSCNNEVQYIFFRWVHSWSAKSASGLCPQLELRNKLTMLESFWFSLSPCQLQRLFCLLFLRFCPFPGQLTLEATTLRMENFRTT